MISGIKTLGFLNNERVPRGYRSAKELRNVYLEAGKNVKEIVAREAKVLGMGSLVVSPRLKQRILG